jgi:hypothetical protein
VSSLPAIPTIGRSADHLIRAGPVRAIGKGLNRWDGVAHFDRCSVIEHGLRDIIDDKAAKIISPSNYRYPVAAIMPRENSADPGRMP